MDRDREQQILSEYEAMLQSAEERLGAAEAEVEDLRPVVALLNRRLSRSVSATTESSKAARSVGDAPPEVDKPEDSPPPDPRPTYRGRPTIPSVVLDILTDGEPHTLDDLHAQLQAHDAFDNGKPSRPSLINRLGDLAGRGDIIKVARGVYKLAQEEGDKNGDGSGAHASVQPNRQSTLDEQDAAHPGTPSV